LTSLLQQAVSTSSFYQAHQLGVGKTLESVLMAVEARPDAQRIRLLPRSATAQEIEHPTSCSSS